MKSYIIVCKYEGYPDTYALFDDNEFAEWTSGGCWERFATEQEARRKIERIKKAGHNPFASYDVLELDY